MDPLILFCTNHSTNSAANPLTSSQGHDLRSSEYHSLCSNYDPSKNNHQPASCQVDPPTTASYTIYAPLRSDKTSLTMVRPQNEKAILDMVPASSSVPFKWEEAPGKPISTSTSRLIETDSLSDKFSHAHPLQLPPCKIHAQAHHSQLLLQNPCSVKDCADEMPADLHYSSRKLELIYQIRPPDHHSPHRLRLLHPTSPSAEFPAFPPSPSVILEQKLKKAYASLVRSASRSQPLHKLLTPACRSFACRSSSVDDLEEEEKVTNYDRFFFDTTCHKDFNCSASMILRKPTLPTYNQGYERKSPDFPIFDKSQTEEDFSSRDALGFLAMDDYVAESITSSPQQPTLLHERQGSGMNSWPAAPASIISLHDMDDNEGSHDYFSPRSSLEDVVSRRIEDGYTESTCSTPLPWFLDFSPHKEEKHRAVNKAGNRMGLARVMALIKIRSTISNKVYRLRREGRRSKAASVQDKSIWSPTLATYFYNNLHKEEVLKLQSIPISSQYVSEDEQSSPDEGPLRINYQLPSIIKGQQISNHYYDLDDELVSPHQVSSGATSSCPSFNPAHDAGNPNQATPKLSPKEQMAAQFNDEYFCPEQSKDYPASVFSKRRDHAHACKGMSKLRKTVQVLATSIKFIGVKMDDRKKEAKRPPLRHRGSLTTIFPLPSPHK